MESGLEGKVWVSYSWPEEGDKTRSPFPDFEVQGIKVTEIGLWQEKWEKLIEFHLEGNKLFDFLVQVFDDEVIQEREKQKPWRLFDTIFLPVE